MEETHLVAAVAARIINRYGRESLNIVAEHCEMATAIGDRPSLEAWRDIGIAVELLQGVPADTSDTVEVTDVIFFRGHRERSPHMACFEVTE